MHTSRDFSYTPEGYLPTFLKLNYEDFYAQEEILGNPHITFDCGLIVFGKGGVIQRIRHRADVEFYFSSGIKTGSYAYKQQIDGGYEWVVITDWRQ